MRRDGVQAQPQELESALGAAVDLKDGRALPEVLTRLKVDNLLVTLGSEGMLLVTKDGRTTHIPSIAREIFDVSGAGDTVTAWLGTALAAGARCARPRSSPTTPRASR
jgi:D-beta-D-heptose 7-phosphate kinase/D-beta-D-heptose 1-phosphate adenosyltransferase